MKIDILHTNDIHSNIANLAKASAIINEVRAKNKNTLLTDSGDMITGDFQFKYNQGQAEIALANHMKYDFVTVGNHDFDCGLDFLKQHMNQLKAKYIISNLIDEDSLIGGYQPYEILDFDGIKVGIISIFDSYLPSLFSMYPQLSAIEKSGYQTIVDNVRAAGADIVVSINHQGLKLDEKLANETVGIDLIIGAHSHTKLTEPVVVGQTYIVQTGSFGLHLGHVTLSVEDKKIQHVGYKLYQLEEISLIDLEAQSLVHQFEQVAAAHSDEIYGTCAHVLEGSREIMTKRSTNLGTLICDSYLDYARKIGFDPNFAIINSRGLRMSISPGPITDKELYNVMPFSKKLVICEVKGSDLKLAVNDIIELQSSNLMIKQDGDGAIHLYDKEINNPIKDEKTYQIATMNYIYEHRLFAPMRKGEVLVRDVSNDIEIVSQYIKTLQPNFKYASNNMVNYESE